MAVVSPTTLREKDVARASFPHGETAVPFARSPVRRLSNSAGRAGHRDGLAVQPEPSWRSTFGPVPCSPTTHAAPGTAVKAWYVHRVCGSGTVSTRRPARNLLHAHAHAHAVAEDPHLLAAAPHLAEPTRQTAKGPAPRSRSLPPRDSVPDHRIARREKRVQALLDDPPAHDAHPERVPRDMALRILARLTEPESAPPPASAPPRSCHSQNAVDRGSATTGSSTRSTAESLWCGSYTSDIARLFTAPDPDPGSLPAPRIQHRTARDGRWGRPLKEPTPSDLSVRRVSDVVLCHPLTR